MTTKVESLKSKVAVVMIGILEGNNLQFEFMFTPGGQAPEEIITALFQYLTLMAQRKAK